MNSSADSSPRPWVALFDLDGTLTWRDTLVPFLLGFLWRHPRRWLGLSRVPLALLGYLRRKDRGQLKSQLIRICMGGESRALIDAWTKTFVENLGSHRRFRATALAVLRAHLEAGDHAVLLSASPDLYVPAIGKQLGFERTLCTEVRWNGERLDGNLITRNRRGEEKSEVLLWLRGQYPGLNIIAYGNSDSDLDHMRKADRALLVNGNSRARRLAHESDILVSNWT